MTTRVVKGSLWTLVGQVAPLGISIFTTPFIVRTLGAESYGVLILIWAIPTYFGFADLGMSTASTKFAAEAFGDTDREREARTVWTAAAIALAFSVPLAAILITFSDVLVEFLNVPNRIRGDAITAVRVMSLLMVVTFLNLIFNTPFLVRLRMDLNSAINAGFRILGLLASAIAIYWFVEISMAAVALLVIAVAQLSVQVVTGRHLFVELLPVRFDWHHFGGMVRYGASLAIAGVAGMALVNVDKIVLARVSSVETVAYYSVAFIFASLTILASSAVTQSLIPAFAQLTSPAKRDQLNSLLERTVRINVIGMLPVIVGLFVIGRPLLGFWFGSIFAEKSTIILYVLLIGVFFSLLMNIPYSLLLASGQTGTVATLFWAELLPFLVLLIGLASLYGAVGAAIAWSLRAVSDSLIMWKLVRRFHGISFESVRVKLCSMLFAVLILLLPISATVYFNERVLLPVIIYGVSIFAYCVFSWKRLLSEDEREFVKLTLSFS